MNNPIQLCQCSRCGPHENKCRNRTKINAYRCEECEHRTNNYRCQYKDCDKKKCTIEKGKNSRCGQHLNMNIA